MIKFINLPKIKIPVLVICIILFILPFFWIKPGELELGGDSSRLYLYDPSSYIQGRTLYSVQPEGMGALNPDQDLLPFVLMLQFFYAVFHSPYILICLLNSIKLVGSFLFMYLVVIEILKNHTEKNTLVFAEMAAILAGFFYTFSPSIGKNWPVALTTTNQNFLNPMIFYLLLRFLITQQGKYLWLLLLTTLIFAPNFSLLAPPVPSAFYPLAFLFLGLYATLYLGKSLPWKKLLLGFILFLGLHAFHIIPASVFTFDPGSYFNLRIFDTKTVQHEGINYFDGIRQYAMVTRSFFYSYGIPQSQWTTFIAPLSVILGLLLSKKRQKDLTLIAAFFFITTFLESANITHIGVAFYRFLFYIPGFSMFRNFYGQWQWVQDFFYSLLVGYALFLILSRLQKKTVYILTICLAGIIIYGSWFFISGKIFRQPHRATDNVSTIIQMDPHYEQTLSFFRNQPDDGKIFDFPFNEFSYQLIPGLNRGAYIGPSPTSVLTGRRDFPGQQILYPFSDQFLKLIKEKDYEDIKRLFGLLNVRYIFYIADPKAYKDFFPEIPYTLLLKILPDSASLTDFVSKIVDEKIFQQGNYLVYYSDKDYYLPHFYVPTTIIPYGQKDDWFGQNTSFFIDSREKDPRIGYIERDICTKIYSKSDCKQDSFKIANTIPVISYKRINPTKYKVVVSGAKDPFLLIFSDKFHKDWKAYIANDESEKIKILENNPKKNLVYFDGSIQEYKHENIFLDTKTFETLSMKSIQEKNHIGLNGYANAWYITPTDVSGKDSYEIIIELAQQRIFYFSLGISLVSLLILLLYGIKLLKK